MWDLTRSLNSQTVNASAGFHCGETEQEPVQAESASPQREIDSFFHHMTSWPLKQEYAIEVASGLCVGLRGRAGADIDALGLTFLLPISHARLTNVRYPTLQLEAASIHPVNIHEFYDENLSYSLPKEWTNTGSYTKTESASWSLTTGIEYHATVGVSAGIPKLAEVSGEFGWQVGVSGTYETTWEESETYGWSLEPSDLMEALTQI
ncbi:hypothetical protein KP509_09G073600 [Ceratopteris richardii]|uniref:Uncharacterized protein n=1 Tax=Ceratopteris richardii TaxID=49495 RepID=A0A8T2U5Y8_CERRI|nr:hypothetical protein KP509_09G073600 [Ceratopteris richardii]